MPIQVLVIADDVESGRRLVDEVLWPAGYAAQLDDGAACGQVIVVDVSRLRGTPLAGLRARRERGDDAPAILLAARLTEEMSVDLFRLGVREFLVKPVDAGALCGAVEALHASRQAVVESRALAEGLRSANESLRRRLEAMRAISAIGRAVVETHDLDRVLTRIAEAATYLTGAEEAALYLAEPGTQELILRASKDPGQVYAAGQRLRAADTIAGEVFRSGQPAIRRGAGSEPDLKVKTGYLVHALVNVALHGKDGRLGVLGVYNRTVARGFDEHHVELLQGLADWASAAIENASAMGQLRRDLADAARPAPSARPETRPQQPRLIAPPGMRDGMLQIMGETDALLAAYQDPLTPGQADGMARIRAQAEAMLKQLDVSEGLQVPPGAGTPDSPDLVSLDLPYLVSEAVNGMRSRAEARGLSLQPSLSGKFPEVVANPARVRQVVEAVLANSIRLTATGGVIVTMYQIQVKRGYAETAFPLSPGVPLADGAWVAISISDTGPGLPASELATLQTARPADVPSHTGTGISLGVAKLIVEAQGGRLWVDRLRAGDAGTIVTLAFPAP